MVVRCAVLQGLKHLLGAFLVTPNQMGFKAFGDLCVSLIGSVVAKLDASTTAKSINGWQNADVVGKPILLRVLDAVVQTFLGGQGADAVGQGVPDHALLILDRSVLVDVVSADLGAGDGASRPYAQTGGDHALA